MKYVVKNGFVDKNTGKPYCIGDYYDCDSLRAEEIAKSGDFLEIANANECNKNTPKEK